MNIERIAAWVVMAAVSVRWAFAWWDDKKTQIEKEAAEAEYYDEGTSAQRKEMLLRRYPQHLIAPASGIGRKK